MIKELQIGTETYFICLAAKKGKLFFSSFKPKYIVLKQNKSIGYITSLMFPLSEMPRLDKQIDLDAITVLSLEEQELTIGFNQHINEPQWLLKFADNGKSVKEFAILIAKCRKEKIKARSQPLIQEKEKVSADNKKVNAQIENHQSILAKTRKFSDKFFTQQFEKIQKSSFIKQQIIVQARQQQIDPKSILDDENDKIYQQFASYNRYLDYLMKKNLIVDKVSGKLNQYLQKDLKLKKDEIILDLNTCFQQNTILLEYMTSLVKRDSERQQ